MNYMEYFTGKQLVLSYKRAMKYIYSAPLPGNVNPNFEYFNTSEYKACCEMMQECEGEILRRIKLMSS